MTAPEVTTLVLARDHETARRALDHLTGRVVTLVPPGVPAQGLVDRWRHLASVDLDDLDDLAALVVDVLAPWRPGRVLDAGGCGPAVAAAETALHAGRRAQPRARTSRPTGPVLLLHRHALESLWTSDGEPLVPEIAPPVVVTHDLAVGEYDALRLPYLFVWDGDDDDAVERLALWIAEVHDVRAVGAVHERALLPAATVREARGLPGPHRAEALAVRDKVVMKDLVSGAGVRVPAYAALPHGDRSRLADVGRVVVKERSGVGSQTVRVLPDASSLSDASSPESRSGTGPDETEWMVEQFVEGSMLHVDSVVSGGRAVFSCASAYLVPPGEWREHRTGGSVLLAGDDLDPRLPELRDRVHEALSIRDAVTHLELFLTPEGDLVFCEIAARPAGGGIDVLVQRAYGIDLHEVALRLACGLPVSQESPPPAPGAWAVVGSEDEPPAWPPGVTAWHDRPHRHLAGPRRHSSDYAHVTVLQAPTAADLHRAIAPYAR